METHGLLAPESAEAVRERYEALGPAARTVVKETARAMEFDREEYGERVTGDVVATARDALFASLLEVRVGTRTEFDEWLEEVDADYEVHLEGSDQVDRVVWHVAPFAGAVVGATYRNERAAAVGTLRRIAFGRYYSSVCTSS
jgi:hypothetical protein